MYRISLLAMISGALALAPAQGFGQEKKEAQPAEKGGPGTGDANKAANPNRALPFRGKVDALDAKAKTITVGTRTIHITSDTKITKDGKAAEFAALTVGTPVRGSLRQAADGKLNAVSLNLDPKAPESAKPAPPPGEKPARGAASGTQKPVQKTAE